MIKAIFMSTKKSINVDVVAITDTGVVREHNEDEFLILPDVTSLLLDEQNSKARYDVPVNGSLFVVADGMGGGSIGEMAAKLTVESLEEYFNKNVAQLTECSFEEEIQVFFNKAVQYCNEKLSAVSQANKEMMGIGATVVFAWLRGDNAYIGWVGDCRAYYAESGKLQLLTKDHTLENELIEKGELVQKNNEIDTQHHIITQILGAHEKRISPGFCVQKLTKGGRLLLLTDGVHGLISDDKIEQCFDQHVMGQNLARDIINKTNEHGGYDNMTVLVCEVLDTDVLVEEKVYEEPKSQTLKIVVIFTVIVVSVLFLLFAL